MQGCSLSLVLFIIFTDRISGHSQGPEGVWFGNNRISSLIFADNVVLLASSIQDLQHVLGQFATECKAAGMKINTSKSKAMVLHQKRLVSLYRLVKSCLRWFRFLRVLFRSKGRIEVETDRWICTASAVIWRSSWFTGQSMPQLSPMVMKFDQKHMIVDTSGRNDFLCRVARRTHRVRGSVNWEELGVMPLLRRVEKSQLWWLIISYHAWYNAVFFLNFKYASEKDNEINLRWIITKNRQIIPYVIYMFKKEYELSTYMILPLTHVNSRTICTILDPLCHQTLELGQEKHLKLKLAAVRNLVGLKRQIGNVN